MRYKDHDWNPWEPSEGQVSYDAAHLAVLMDLRDEMKAIRSSLDGIRNILLCRNFQQVPATLRGIRKAVEPKARKVSA